MTQIASPQYPAAKPLATAGQPTNAALIQRGFNYLLIGGFLFGLAVPFFGLFQGDVSEEIAQSEGRPAAVFPHMTFKGNVVRRPDTRSIKEFPQQFEKWLNDRLGCRKQLIQIYQVARYYGWTPHLLSKSRRSGAAATGVMAHLNQSGTTVSGQNRVLIGREGWLFYQTDDVTNDYRGTDLFTESELARWKQVLTERRDWLAKRGIRYVFVVPPNKHSIYPEYMPRSVNRVSTNSRLAQLADYMKRESDVAFISLLDPMLEAKSQQRLFHKTDTHWNAYGAFIGAQEIYKVLKTWFPAIYVPTLQDYEVVVHDCDLQSIKHMAPWVKMDLAVMQGSPVPYREQVIDLVPRKPHLNVPVQLEGVPQSQEELTKHQTLVQGQISNVFVIHDSYMMALAPFLAPNFQQVTYQWKSEFPAEEIERTRPVLVIQQLVQRRLMSHKPANPPLVTEELRSRK